MESKRQIEILNLIIFFIKIGKTKKLNGICPIVDNLHTRSMINFGEYQIIKQFILDNKPTADNEYSKYLDSKFWYDGTYWWLPMNVNKNTKQIRINYINDLIDNIFIVKDERKIEILNNIISEFTEGKADVLTGICDSLTLMQRRNKITEAELSVMMDFINENKPTKDNHYKQYTKKSTWIGEENFWWLPIRINLITREVRIAYLKELIINIK